MVGLRDERFVVFSKSLGQEIRVMETHLLNSGANAANACKFLSLYSYDGKRGAGGFDWGPAASMPFLPRVTVDRVVLCRARWQISSASLKLSDTDQGSKNLVAWLHEWNVPRYVVLTELDSRLFIDLGSTAGLALLRDRAGASKASRLVLEEHLPAIDDNWLLKDGESHTVEFLATFLATQRPAVRTIVPVAESHPLGVGSEWAYVKLYAGHNQIDSILKDHLAPFVSSLRLEQRISDWFFLRYADPDSHLRVRFRRNVGKWNGDALQTIIDFCESLLTGGEIVRYSFETYERENERYGGHTAYGNVEQIFAVSSDMCLALLSSRFTDEASRSVAVLLSLEIQISELLNPRDLEAFIRTLPARGKLSREEWQVVRSVQSADRSHLSEFSKRLAPLCQSYRRACEDDRLTSDLPSIAVSIAHMHCNRMGVIRSSEERVMRMLVAINRSNRFNQSRVSDSSTALSNLVHI